MNTSFSLGALVAGSCFLGALAASNPADPKEAALLQLREDFHLANTLGDYELMHSLWAEDAVFTSAAGQFTGPAEITDFLAAGPYWGTTVSLTSESKTTFVRHGNTADYVFECILVHTGGGDPLTTSLSTIPPGAQNPAVEIVQHSHGAGTAVLQGKRWVFQDFTGTPGAL